VNPFQNHIIKSKFNGPGDPTILFDVESGYDLNEHAQWNLGAAHYFTVRMNALALNGDYLYSYDGKTVKAWDKASGAELGSLDLDPAYSGGQNRYNEGIAVDECNNLYIGGRGVLHKFSFDGTTFTQTGTITNGITDDVYDVHLNRRSGILYVSGNGFACTYNVGTVDCKNFETVTGYRDIGGNLYDVWVEIIGGNPPFSIEWNTGSTNDTLYGVPDGTYYVTIIDSSCNPDTVKDTVIIDFECPRDSIYIVKNLLCNGDTDGEVAVDLGNLDDSTEVTYSWSNDASTNNAEGIGEGWYYVTITTVNPECELKDSIYLPEPELLVLSIDDHEDILCHGDNTGSITSSATGGTGNYYFSINGTSTGVNSFFENLAAEDYLIKVTDENGCVDSLPQPITEPTPLEAEFSPDQEICPGDCVDLIATASGATPDYTFIWSDAQTGSTRNVCPTENTSYSIVITDANNCPPITHTFNISITTGTIIPSSKNDTICIGEEATLSINFTGGVTPFIIDWQPGGNDSKELTYYPTEEETYTVTISDNCGASTSTEVSVIINPLPPVNFDSDKKEGCVPLEVNFYNSGMNGETCIWDFGDGYLAASCNEIDHLYDTPGVYTVSLHITDINGCENTDTIPQMIKVWPNPTANFSPSPTIATLLQPKIKCTDLSYTNIVKWKWNFNEEYTSEEQHPSYAFSDTGVYFIRLDVEDEHGCKDDITKYVEVQGEFTIYVPNAFTPNGDGTNDFFPSKDVNLDKSTYQLFIFNRWGELIYYTENVNAPWNGQRNKGLSTNTLAQEDVYVWKIKGQSIYGEKVNLIGRVTLIR
jgi:gliding motility-associated-like protein